MFLSIWLNRDIVALMNTYIMIQFVKELSGELLIPPPIGANPNLFGFKSLAHEEDNEVIRVLRMPEGIENLH